MTGNHWSLVVDNDTARPADEMGGHVAEARAAYTVVSPAGLFKNGRQYAAGDVVELTDKCAVEFLRLKEIEPA